MRLRFAFLVLCALLVLAVPARAEDEYVKPTWPNLLHTLIRFKALDLTDMNILDDYGIVTECRLYTSFYKNDFKWQQVRQAMMKSIAMNVATFPATYRYDLTLELDRYDFAAKLFRFKEKSIINNVNTFVIYSVLGDSCGDADIKYMPRTFRVVTDTPVSMEGIPLPEQDARDLIKRMNEAQNDKRIVFVRFNLRMVYIAPWHKIPESIKETGQQRYEQEEKLPANNMRLDARLDSISFYEDADRTKLIFQY